MENMKLQTTDGSTVTVSVEEIANAISNEGILDSTEEQRPYFYLAALALDTMNNDEYDIHRTLREYINNESTVREHRV